ncbi:MAG: Gfo/Idh/MocA family oxidoreductase [Clostridiaceae bacterium]|nr:Gfo/Idh/MocA family oxidoreductase [Clostridiaceae bacterium]
MKNGTVRIAMISASGMAHAHMDSIVKDPKLELAAICDIDQDKLAKAGEQYGVTALYTDYKEMLKDETIDAVVVCTPDQLHKEMTINALESGKHVLCEKPMSLSLDDCLEMIAAEKRTGKKLMVGQICRYTPGFIAAKKLVDEGAIGELFFVESEYAHDYSKIGGAGNWRRTPERHGFLGGGCHAVDLLRWIAGNPTEVFAYANRKMLTDWPVDDCTISVMKFPNNVIGKVFVSIGCKRGYTMRTVLYGSRGTIICDNTSKELQLFQVTEDKDEFTTPKMIPVQVNNHNTFGELDEFADLIKNDLPVKTTGQEGASTVVACLAAVESARIDAPVKISYNF